VEDSQCLQRVIDEVKQWCDKWLNVSKCNVMSFTSKINLDTSYSSSSGGTLEEHSRFHGASPGRTIDARCNAEWSPRLSGLRSLSIVRSQDWWGRPVGRRQSTGRQSVDAHSTREWSSEAAARAMCPNRLRRRCCISEETGGWSVCDHTDTVHHIALEIMIADRLYKRWTQLKTSEYCLIHV